MKGRLNITLKRKGEVIGSETLEDPNSHQTEYPERRVKLREGWWKMSRIGHRVKLKFREKEIRKGRTKGEMKRKNPKRRRNQVEPSHEGDKGGGYEIAGAES